MLVVLIGGRNGDPHHIAQPVLRGLAENTAFRFERVWGSGSNYTIAFRG